MAFKRSGVRSSLAPQIIMKMFEKTKSYLYPFFLTFLTIISSSCDDTLTVEDIDKKPIPAVNVRFSENIYPVLNIKCNSSGCHNDESRAGNISLTTWSNVTDPRIIVKGDTTTSVLVWSITKIPGAKWMPPNSYPQLTFEQIRGIKTWIQEGALNN